MRLGVANSRNIKGQVYPGLIISGELLKFRPAKSHGDKYREMSASVSVASSLMQSTVIIQGAIDVA